MTKIQFGTDGWRAVIAEDFTFANVQRVAQANADFWMANGKGGGLVIVAYDRRFHSDQFGITVAEVMAGNGYVVILCKEPTPTPAASYAVKKLGAVGGVMITASHNPASFNGYKIKADYGGSAQPEDCKAIEALLDKNPISSVPLATGIEAGSIKIADLTTPYLAALKKQVNFKLIAKSPIKFAHEAMFGVGAGCFDRLLAGTRVKVTTLDGEHNPSFRGIAPEPVPKNYIYSSPWLKQHPQGICVVTDGDADRVGGMDGKGNPLSTHQIICLLLNHFVHFRHAKGRVIKALTTTSMVDKICADLGLELVETGVGFKYICAEMLKGNVLLGFEESGGIAYPSHLPERDGILSGLMLLEVLAVRKKPLNFLLGELEKKYGPHRYSRLDTHFPLEKRPLLMEYCKQNPPAKLLKSKLKEVKSFDGVKFIAEDGAWLMLRGSGTEPILRIYAEAASDAGAKKLIDLGVALTKQV